MNSYEPFHYTTLSEPEEIYYKKDLAIIIALFVIIIICIIVIYAIKSTIPKQNTCSTLISYYSAKLGQSPLNVRNTAFSSDPKYLTPTKYCDVNLLPRLTTYIDARYIAIINNNTFPITIPTNSILVHTSEVMNVAPINAINANVVNATISYPDNNLNRDAFIFNNMSTYNGVIQPNEIALIKFTGSSPIYLYSIVFKYISTETIPITLYLFDPATNANYSSGQNTSFKYFYQLNLNNITTNTTIVIDFE